MKPLLPTRSRLLTGAFWLSSASLLTTLMSIGAQIVLGFLLSESDFGVYGLAIAVANMVQVVRDGGVRLVTTRMSSSDLESSHKTLVGYSAAAAFIVASLLCGAGLVAAQIYSDPRVSELVLILAAAIPLGFYAPVGFGALHAQLRFERATQITAASSALRHTGVVLLALAGFGPFSFVIPVLAVNAFESVTTWTSVRRSLATERREAASGLNLRPLLGSMAGTWLTFVSLSTDTLLLGLFLPVSVLGFYYFGFQLVWKVVGLFNSVRDVAIPAFAQRGLSTGLFVRATRLTIAVSTLLVVPLILLGPPAINLVWGEQWLPSIGTTLALASALPYFSLARLSEMATVGAGRFSLWTGQVAIRALGVASGALVGGFLYTNSATLPAVFVSAGIVISSLVVLGLTARTFRTWSREIATDTFLLSPAFVAVSLGMRFVLDAWLSGALATFGAGLIAASLLITVGLRLFRSSRTEITEGLRDMTRERLPEATA